MARRMAALVLSGVLSLLPGAFASAENAYGGSAQDDLQEAVFAGDGLFAVGSTASTDGDLVERIRSGEAGWALRVDEAGHVLWSFSSARSGMMEMISPYAHEDGTFSCILTEATHQRGEWITLGESGRQVARVDIPSVDALCADGGHIEAMVPYEDAQGPSLAVVISHPGAGTMCCARVLENGKGLPGVLFEGDAQGCVATDETGAEGVLVHLGVQQGELMLTRVLPGVQVQPETVKLEPLGEDLLYQRVTDALVGDDGSVVLCGQALSSGGDSVGFLMRLSAEGERLFALLDETYSHFVHLAATESGFAAYAYREEADGGADGAACDVVFFDEDGTVQGRAKERGDIADLADGLEGVTALYNLAPSGKKQAVFKQVVPKAEQEMQALYADTVYIQQDCTLLDALSDDAGIVLAVCRTDGMVDVTRVDTQGHVLLHCAGVAEAGEGCLGMGEDGCIFLLLTGEEPALLTIDAQGRVSRTTLPTARQILPGDGTQETLTALACDHGALLCARAGQERMLVRTDERGAFTDTQAVSDQAGFTGDLLGALPLKDGFLLYGAGERGAQLLRVDASLEERWHTRTPIHTAADALEWRCGVALASGEMMLAGRYLTERGGQAGQEGVAALLGSGGELKDIRRLEDVGAVYDMAISGGEVCMLAATGAESGAEADVVLRGAGQVQRAQSLPCAVEGLNARLLQTAGGLYVVGVEAETGAVVVQLVP